MSGAMIFIKEDLKISDVQVGVLAGILNLCALVGSLAAGRTSDYIGRRYTILLSSIIFLVGAVLMGYGPNYAVLMIGRCTSGIGVGFALMIAPVYAAEISSPTSRGTLTSLPELCISIGLLFGYVSNYFFGKLALKLGWRLMLGVAGVPSVALATGILKMPESPRWLAMQGRLEEAKEVLELVSNTKQEAQARFHDIKMAIGIDETDVVKHRIIKNRGEGEEVVVDEHYRDDYMMRCTEASTHPRFALRKRKRGGSVAEALGSVRKRDSGKRGFWKRSGSLRFRYGSA
ncbi:hypothetical protein ACLB2K_005825 [Fragaria x ananassa]